MRLLGPSLPLALAAVLVGGGLTACTSDPAPSPSSSAESTPSVASVEPSPSTSSSSSSSAAGSPSRTPSPSKSPYAATPVPPSETPTARPRGCGDVHFDTSSDNAAWDIRASGVTCGAAIGLVRAVVTKHRLDSPARQVRAQGWTCGFSIDGDGMPTGHYSCRKGSAQVTFDRT